MRLISTVLITTKDLIGSDDLYRDESVVNTHTHISVMSLYA